MLACTFKNVIKLSTKCEEIAVLTLHQERLMYRVEESMLTS